MKKAIIVFVCLYQLFFLLPAGAGVAAPVNNRKPVGNAVIIVIDRITVEDLINAELKNIQKLAGAGAIGLMTTNPAGGAPRLPENTYTTIGAGFKVKGGQLSGQAYNATEPFENGTAGEAYMQRTGRKPAADAVVHLGIVDILQANSNLKYKVTIGTLGEALHLSGKKTAVIGNADIYKDVNRHGVNIAMDSLGLVDYGDVGADTMVNAPDRITGRKPDYRSWLFMFKDLREKADLIVIETGVTSILDKMTDITTNDALQRERNIALQEIDGFIGQLAEQLDLRRDLLLIIAPEPTFAAMEEQRFLTPVIAAGKDIEPGLLWSGTVKRNGVVANTDIAPTVAGFFGIKTGQPKINSLFFNGQIMRGRAAQADIITLENLNNKIVGINKIRYPLVKGFINSVLIVVVITVAGLCLRKRFVRHLKPVLVALTAVPLALLWTGAVLPQPELLSGILAAIGLTLLITAIGYIAGHKNELGPFVVIALLTSVTIIADLFLGAPLNKTSPLSYDPMTGARFYGLGNEYMGVFIGALIAGMTGLVSVVKSGFRQTGTVLSGVFLLGLYVIAAPALGTNVGGGIAAVAGFGATIMVLAGYAVNRRTLLALAAGVVLVTGVFVAFDLSRSPEAQSHMGRTISLVREAGAGELVNIIARKAAMNWKLIKSTTWSWSFLASLAGFLIFNYFRPAVARKIKNDHPSIQQGMAGIIIGAVAALIFNDSGVMAAATMIYFGIAPYLTLIINREEAAT